MNKTTLETFVKKFNLNGNVESVKWIVDSKEKQLKTSSITDDKNVFVYVELKEFTDLSDMEIGIYDTAKLKQMLGVLGEQIQITPNVKNDKVTSLNFSDDNTKVQFVTADLSIIQTIANIKKIPDFNAEIELTEDFITKFIKAKNALSDVDTFTLVMNKKNKLEMVMGYTNTNSNKITLNVTSKEGKDTVSKPLSFSAKYLKEILISNNDCDNAILKASDNGLATITFIKDNFTSTYYLIEIKSVD
jgi:hypothetical protein